MGHLQDMNNKQRADFISFSYQRKLEENKGSNFEYWSDKHEQMLLKGWELYDFKDKSDYDINVTQSELIAKDIVKELRDKNNYARVVCGYTKNRQRIKMFSVIYKSK